VTDSTSTRTRRGGAAVFVRVLALLGAGAWAVLFVSSALALTTSAVAQIAALIAGVLPLILLARSGLFSPPAKPPPAGATANGSHMAVTVESDDTVYEALSERELEVLTLLISGRSNREIAQELVISVGTVKTHTNNIYRKLGARNRAEALARARRLQLV
jgi:ATP/maltotriose-dependent transcriptional regulator MalT